MRLSINTMYSGKPPAPDRLFWREFNGSFKNVQLDADEVLALISEGFAIAPQHHTYRRADNFIAGGYIGLDFDSLGRAWTLDRLAGHGAIAELASIVHTTSSHTDAEPRYRVIFELDPAIITSGLYSELASAMVHVYKQADAHCTDACRFFFGAPSCDAIQMHNVLMESDAMRLFIKPYKQRPTSKPVKPVQSKIQYSTTRPDDAMSPDQVHQNYLKQHSSDLRRKVRRAADGQKHGILRNVSRTFGGYIAGGYYSELDVISWLQDDIRQCHNVQSLDAADSTIVAGIAFGAKSPLFIRNGA